MDQTTDLAQFIERIGDDRAARLFGVKPRTAKSWRLRDRFPSRKQIPKIIKGSKGEVTVEGCYTQRKGAA